MAISDYESAKQMVQRAIDTYNTIPLHQGTCDVTEIIAFQNIADYQSLTEKQYNQLIDWGQRYLDKLIKNQYYN